MLTHLLVKRLETTDQLSSSKRRSHFQATCRTWSLATRKKKLLVICPKKLQGALAFKRGRGFSKSHHPHANPGCRWLQRSVRYKFLCGWAHVYSTWVQLHRKTCTMFGGRSAARDKRLTRGNMLYMWLRKAMCTCLCMYVGVLCMIILYGYSCILSVDVWLMCIILRMHSMIVYIYMNIYNITIYILLCEYIYILIVYCTYSFTCIDYLCTCKTRRCWKLIPLSHIRRWRPQAAASTDHSTLAAPHPSAFWLTLGNPHQQLGNSIGM